MTAAIQLPHSDFRMQQSLMKLHLTTAPPQQFESNLWFPHTVLKDEPQPTSSLKHLEKKKNAVYFCHRSN